MELSEMKTGLFYEVTRESHDGTFQKGTVIKRTWDDSIVMVDGGGWLDKEEWSQPGVSEYCEVEIWYPREREKALKKSMTGRLDIDDTILEYSQTSMSLISLNSYGDRTDVSELAERADEFWQIAEWLRELKSLRQAVRNQFSRGKGEESSI